MTEPESATANRINCANECHAHTPTPDLLAVVCPAPGNVIVTTDGLCWTDGCWTGLPATINCPPGTPKDCNPWI